MNASAAMQEDDSRASSLQPEPNILLRGSYHLPARFVVVEK